MKSKRCLIFILLLITCSLFAEPLDIIVMIDTSSSMEPYFDNLINYLFMNTLSNNLYLGDRFHLLCFSSYPTIELAETLKNEDSIKYMQKEINFLKGRLIFGRYTDLLSALKLVIDYAETLGTDSNKRILLLSDGIHDPPPDSPYMNISIDVARREVARYVQKIIDKDGWSIRILRMPDKSVPDNVQPDDMKTSNTESTFDSEFFLNKEHIIKELDTTKGGEPTNGKQVTASRERPTDGKQTDASRKGTTDNKQTATSREQPTNGKQIDISRERLTGRTRTDAGMLTGKVQSNLSADTGNTPLPHPDSTLKSNLEMLPEKSQGYNLFDELTKDIDVDIVDFNQNNNQELPHVTIGFPKLLFPDNLGEKEKEFTIPFVVQSFQDSGIVIQLNRIEDNKGTVLTKSKTSVKIKPQSPANLKVKIRLPDYISYGTCDLPIRLFFDDDHRISPREGVISFTYVPPVNSRLSEMITDNLYILLFILLGIVLLFLIILLIKHIFFSLNFSNYFKPAPYLKHRNFPYKDYQDLIEMRVSMQNSHIGFRNIHRIEENSSFMIGGKRSPYLIFLVPMPANIAVITRKNGEFIFIPKKMEFFPDLVSPVKDCLNKPIKAVSSKGYEMTLTFGHYVSPLDEINKLLHSIKHIEDL